MRNCSNKNSIGMVTLGTCTLLINKCAACERLAGMGVYCIKLRKIFILMFVYYKQFFFQNAVGNKSPLAIIVNHLVFLNLQLKKVLVNKCHK